MAQLDYGTAGKHGLSYSRRQTLHSCARKFQLENVLGLKARIDTVTFSYGHAVAAGVQEWFKSGSTELAVVACTMAYTYPWQDVGTASEQRGKKSVWYAAAAVLKFIEQMNKSTELVFGGMAELQDYELAILSDNQPAIELQFRILLENDYVYEGHIDLVVVHKKTGEFAILEIKTTTFRDPHDAQYANSDQALSYSIVLDKAVGHALAAYKVIYLIYSSSQQQWFVKQFHKMAKQRLDWLNNLVRDTELISYYQQAADDLGLPYPTNGGACYDFFRPCDYFRTCGMEDESLRIMYGAGSSEPETSFDYTDRATLVFTFDEILNAQIARIAQEGYSLELINTTEGGDNGTIDYL